MNFKKSNVDFLFEDLNPRILEEKRTEHEIQKGQSAGGAHYGWKMDERTVSDGWTFCGFIEDRMAVIFFKGFLKYLPSKVGPPDEMSTSQEPWGCRLCFMAFFSLFLLLHFCLKFLWLNCEV